MTRQANFLAAHDFNLEPWVNSPAGPGVVAAILSGGAVMSSKARGHETTSARAPALDTTSVFYVASLAKQFTAACVTLCEIAGDVDVDASVRRLLPELSAAFEPVTPRLALHHLAGLPRDQNFPGGIGDDPWDDKGLWDLIEILGAEPKLLASPGDQHIYSNPGYWILAAIVERASGRTLAEFAQARLFRPLGMLETRFRDNPDQAQPGLAPGHRQEANGPIEVKTRFHGVGDGGLLTSVQDLAKWDEFWSGRSPLGDELPLRLLDQGRRNDGKPLYYARGVTVRSHRGAPIISHGGNYTGYLAKLVRFPRQDFSIVCLANSDAVNVDGLAMAIADQALAGILDMSAPSWADSVREDALAA